MKMADGFLKSEITGADYKLCTERRCGLQRLFVHSGRDRDLRGYADFVDGLARGGQVDNPCDLAFCHVAVL